MNYQIEKWILGCFFIITAILCVGAALASHQRNECRLELAKAGRSAEDIVKICP